MDLIDCEPPICEILLKSVVRKIRKKAKTFIFFMGAIKSFLIFKDPCKFRTLATEYFPNHKMCFVLRVIIIER